MKNYKETLKVVIASSLLLAFVAVGFEVGDRIHAAQEAKAAQEYANISIN
jgi:predicted negative regulator of RcsB-dependent stress response